MLCKAKFALIAMQKFSHHVMYVQNAVMNDRNGYYLFVVNAENVVEMRRITTGDKVDNGFVVTKGLKADEKVIVQGPQKVKPGAKVTVNLIEPTVGVQP